MGGETNPRPLYTINHEKSIISLITVYRKRCKRSKHDLHRSHLPINERIPNRRWELH
jgi:hypothetical protein